MRRKIQMTDQTNSSVQLVPTSSTNTASVDQATTIATTVFNQLSSHTPLNVGSILVYAIESMQLIEKVSGLTGQQKFSLLGNVLTQIINNSSLSQDLKTEINAVVTAIIPTFATIVCKAAKGLLELNQEIEQACCQKKCCTVS